MNTSKSILDKIKQSSFFKKIESEEKANLLNQRREAAQALAMLEKDVDPSKEINSKIDVARKQLQAAKDLVKKKQRVLTGFERDQMILSNSRNVLFNKNTNFLKNTYDEKIDAAIAFFKKRRNFIRGKDITLVFVEKKFNFDLFKKKPVYKTNAPEIEKALIYCLDAIRQLNDMKLAPECDPARIDRLKTGLPEKHLLASLRVEESPRLLIEYSKLTGI